MNCPECQRSLDQSAIFCSYCGHQLQSAEETIPQEPDIPPALGSTIDLRRFRQAAPAAPAAASNGAAPPLLVPATTTAAHRHHRHQPRHHQRQRHGPHPLFLVVGAIVLFSMMRGGGGGLMRALWPMLLIGGGISMLGGHSGRRFVQHAFKFAIIGGIAVLGVMILFGILKFAFIALVVLGLIWLASKILG